MLQIFTFGHCFISVLPSVRFLRKIVQVCHLKKKQRLGYENMEEGTDGVEKNNIAVLCHMKCHI